MWLAMCRHSSVFLYERQKVTEWKGYVSAEQFQQNRRPTKFYIKSRKSIPSVSGNACYYYPWYLKDSLSDSPLSDSTVQKEKRPEI